MVGEEDLQFNSRTNGEYILAGGKVRKCFFVGTKEIHFLSAVDQKG